MNKITKAAVTAALLSIAATLPAAAQNLPKVINPEVGKAVMADLGGEFAECAAFYSLGAGLGKRDWPDRVQENANMEAVSREALTMALALTGKDVALANFKIALDTMGRDTGGDTHKMPIVIAKFGPRCKDLMEHPEIRMTYWVEVENAGFVSAQKKK